MTDLFTTDNIRTTAQIFLFIGHLQNSIAKLYCITRFFPGIKKILIIRYVMLIFPKF